MRNFSQRFGGSIKGVRRGVISTSGSAVTATATLSPAVTDIAKCELRLLGITSTANTPSYFAWRIELTNTTTITATRMISSSAVSEIAWELTEYN